PSIPICAWARTNRLCAPVLPHPCRPMRRMSERPQPQVVAEMLHAAGIAVLRAEIERLETERERQQVIITGLTELAWAWISGEATPPGDRGAFAAAIQAILAGEEAELVT